MVPEYANGGGTRIIEDRVTRRPDKLAETNAMRARLATAVLVTFMAFGASGAYGAGTDTTTALTPAKSAPSWQMPKG